MDANNNLEPDAFANFRQISQVPDSKDVNVLLLFARQGTHVTPDTNAPTWAGSLRFKMRNGIQPEFEESIDKQIDPNLEESAIPDEDMGQPETFENFVTWAQSNYPANHYMLILWDHGDGWRFLDTSKLAGPKAIRKAVLETRSADKGKILLKSVTSAPPLVPAVPALAAPEKSILPDETLNHAPFRALTGDEAHGGTVLYNRDIQDSLRKVLKEAKLEKLDVLGFDSCLMAMLETAYGMRNVANVMVGSEEVEPGAGWPYQAWLTALVQNPSMTPQQLASTIVDSYDTEYRPRGKSSTLSAINLSLIQGLADSIDSFSRTLLAGLRRDAEKRAIQTVRDECIVYGSNFNMQNVDIGYFSDVLSRMSHDSRLRDAAAKVKLGIDSTMIRAYWSVDRDPSYGLAIYFPASRAVFETDKDAFAAYEPNSKHPVEFVQDRKWPEFIKGYCDKVPK